MKASSSAWGNFKLTMIIKIYYEFVIEKLHIMDSIISSTNLTIEKINFNQINP